MMITRTDAALAAATQGEEDASAAVARARTALAIAEPGDAPAGAAVLTSAEAALRSATRTREAAEAAIATAGRNVKLAELGRAMKAADGAACRAGLAEDAAEIARAVAILESVITRTGDRIARQAAAHAHATELAAELNVEGPSGELIPHAGALAYTWRALRESTAGNVGVRAFLAVPRGSEEAFLRALVDLLDVGGLPIFPGMEGSWSVEDRITAALDGSYVAHWRELAEVDRRRRKADMRARDLARAEAEQVEMRRLENVERARYGFAPLAGRL